MSFQLSHVAENILVSKPRIWEYLLFSQILADQIAIADEADNGSERRKTVFSCDSNDIQTLLDYLIWAKASALQLGEFSLEQGVRLIEPLKRAVGEKGCEGYPDLIIQVAVSLGQLYADLTNYVRRIGGCVRVYSSDFPPMARDSFEAVFSDMQTYFLEEAQLLLAHFRKYGAPAVLLLQDASEILAAGKNPGRVDALSHNHNIAPFDTANIDILTAMINHLSATDAPANDQSGFVYLLVNRSMPGLVKIGHTTREARARIRELSCATGVPTPFELIFDQFVDNSALAEQRIHERLASVRVAANREFFMISISSAIKVMLDVTQKKQRHSIEDRLASSLESLTKVFGV